MKQRICTACGANELVREKGSFKCAYCGTVHVSEGNRSSIALNDDIEALLQKCRENPSRASRYANLVLDIDPDNVEALRYV